MTEKPQLIPPVAEGVFSLPPYDEAPPVLLGGYCPRCNRYDFPRPDYCRACLKPTQQAALGGEGTIYSYTVIRVKPPLGLPSPYAVGYVDLKDTGLRIFCLLDPAAVDSLQIGQAVSLRVSPLGVGVDGAPRLRPFFTPASRESDKTEG